MTRPAWAIPVVIVAAVVLLVGLVTCSSSPPDQPPDTSTPQSPGAASPPAQPSAAGGASAAASTAQPLDLIPADNLLCWKGMPFPGAERTPDEPSSLRTLMDIASRVFGGRIDNAHKISVRILETLGIVGRYPFAVALLDASAKPARADGSGAKLDQLRIAVAIKTGSLADSEPFLRIIQKTVNEMTDAGAATLRTRQVRRWEYHELTDARLPAWCAVAWGQLDQHFVISLGRDVWPLIAAAANGDIAAVGNDKWVTQVRRQRPDEPLIEVLVATRRIRERLDPFVGNRATAFFKPWRIDDVDRMHWALGFEGRALYCLANFREGKSTQRRLYANPNARDPRLLQTIPEEARYAVYRLPARTFLPRLISSLYAIRSPQERQAAADVWAKIQADLKIDAQRDALDHLGDHIVAHNYPQHPAHLPLAFTSLIEIRDEPRKVRETLEKLLWSWQESIDEAALEQGTLSPIRIHYDDDGIWHLQVFIIHGVAWTFTDRFIVTSWEADALRQYLAVAGDKLGRRE
jgi:hypothetical protein